MERHKTTSNPSVVADPGIKRRNKNGGNGSCTANYNRGRQASLVKKAKKAFCSQKAIQALHVGAKGQSRGKRNKCRRPRVARYAGLPLDGPAAPRGESGYPRSHCEKPP